MARYIFECSRAAHNQITELFDFVSPTIIALWNLRFQVKGFLVEFPDATSVDLSSRFALGSGQRGGELKKACADTEWDQQRARFSWFILVNTIAIFEDYVGQIGTHISNRADEQRKLSESLQFPNPLPPNRAQHRVRTWAYEIRASL
jgi:hypothetical protein